MTERLGGGAMGEVWCADDGVLERRVAVKILLPALLDDAAFMERFRREAKLLAALNHPGIVEVYDYGESTGDSGTRVAYIVMELITGRPLDEELSETGPMSADQALGIVAQALDALHVAHRRQIVHRDIKPSNLMMRDDGRVVVTDFGIASAAAGTRITSSHAILGTALYVAPERAEGAASIPASDLYSMGVLCYEMLTGEPPFTGETALEIVLKHVREPAPELPDAFPQPVRDLVAKALAKKPEDRFTSAAVMAAAARRASGAAAAAGAAAAPAPADSRTLRLVPAVPPQTPTVATPPVTPPGASVADSPLVTTLAAEERPRDRRGWRRLLIPVIIPCTITVGVGTALLIDPSPFRTDAGAGASDARPTVVVSGPRTGGAGSAAASTSAGAASPSASASPSPSPSPSPAPSAPGAAGAASAPAPGTGTVPPPGGGSGSGSQPVTIGQNGGGSGGGGAAPAPGQGAPAAPTTAAAPGGGATHPATPPPPAPGSGAPAGCGGAGWGAIVNVGDGLKLGLAADSLSGGTTVVTGGTTAYGWVHWADSFQRFNACDRSQPALTEVATFDGSPVGVRLASFNDFMTAWTTAATGSGSYYIKDYMGQSCLTDNGAGNPVTVGTCTPGNGSQEWLLP
ncbi:serine/threonine-protein kinase [Kitasatospora sp. MAA4]|uniref:serine/threonine-protein kinase n=1 Tax=Kitasatospora sp. MAA4 TaxID=3035093 RepID=UPI002476ACD0|nr:serine/threonine-protein kinase [Kitasatospora sp. MAA4]